MLGSAAAAATTTLLPVLPAATSTFVPGRNRQGLGTFVKNLDTAIQAGDQAGIEAGLKMFGLDDAVEVKSSGAAEQPVVVSTRTGLASTKVTMRVESAVMEPDHYVKLLWLRDADSGEVITCREILKLSEAAEMVEVTVPKGSRVVPVALCYNRGVVTCVVGPAAG